MATAALTSVSCSLFIGSDNKARHQGRKNNRLNTNALRKKRVLADNLKYHDSKNYLNFASWANNVTNVVFLGHFCYKPNAPSFEESGV
jgi:hypothetical protein